MDIQFYAFIYDLCHLIDRHQSKSDTVNDLIVVEVTVTFIH